MGETLGREMPEFHQVRLKKKGVTLKIRGRFKGCCQAGLYARGGTIETVPKKRTAECTAKGNYQEGLSFQTKFDHSQIRKKYRPAAVQGNCRKGKEEIKQTGGKIRKTI